MKRKILSGILMDDFILEDGKSVLLEKLKSKGSDFKLFPTNLFIKVFSKAVKEKDTAL